jgi:branched-chain amino acid transport system substrate-binding protein
MSFISRLTSLLGTALLIMNLQLAAADTLKIGISASLSDPAGETGPSLDTAKFGVLGAKLAADEINKNGGVLGRQIELVAEDNWMTEEGAVLGFSKLAAETDIVAFIGPVFSSLVHAISPDVIKVGKPMMVGGSAPILTHMGNPWLFRCRPNDSYSARVMAEFGANILGKRKWAIVYTDDTFGNNAKDVLLINLKSLGIDPVIVQTFARNSSDFSSIVNHIKTSNVDIIGSYIDTDNDFVSFSHLIYENSITIPHISSAIIADLSLIKKTGSDLHGAYGVTDFNEHSNLIAKTFSLKYQETYHIQPSYAAAWAYDAMNLLALAITNANSTAPEAIRAAILAIHGYQGAEGIYNFDQYGDGLHGYNIVRIENGKIVFVRYIEFTD